MKPLRIVFMGTPEFAVPCLEALVASGRQVVGVVTAEDKPQGRGQKAGISAVKACAQKHGLRILQPAKLKAPEFVEELKSLQADLQIVVAFRMLPEVVWAMPRLGTFNLHASLLPKYRGAAPINWAIMNGEKETGVTTFFLQHEIDTGSIIFQETEPILDADDVGSLYERLMNRGAKLVLKTVEAIENGTAPRLPQVWDGSAPHAPKIFKETCKIDWSQTGEQIRNFIRGLSPYPAAWTELNGKPYKVHQVSVEKIASDKPVGKIQSDSKTYLKVSCADGWVSLKEFQPEGKKRMGIEDFLRGNKI
jgi:methionyl-tRNA formyltransferase